ncbi:flavodoxin family protein [uncultured Methanobrevibacter sp.]|uniref:flavodoxin family protein n=1 Tax=uncultured Methanobrevibacter sp. TaxID=253161 RepID=UPI0025F0FBDC|nr:NAD(P)H-dependent oxidoreductase [uncultured Methanobrevibacter sp.]
MKYLIINGSPRRKNTCKIIRQVKTNLDGEFEQINLIEMQIPLCIGCYNCIVKGEEYCPHHDKVKPIVEKIRSCDGLIIGSPVYAMNVTALLKNFLDHTAYLYHRPEFFTKKALVVVSTAGAGHKKVSKYIDETLRHWGVNNVCKIAMACGGKETLETDEIDKVSRKFKRDVESGDLHGPKFNDIVFYNVWRAMAVSENPIEVDRKFWIENDLINHDFSPMVGMNVFKRLFSKLMFFILRRVMK